MQTKYILSVGGIMGWSRLMTWDEICDWIENQVQHVENVCLDDSNLKRCLRLENIIVKGLPQGSYAQG